MILKIGSESEYLYCKTEDKFWMLNGTDLKYRKRFWRIMIASNVKWYRSKVQKKILENHDSKFSFIWHVDIFKQ